MIGNGSEPVNATTTPPTFPPVHVHLENVPAGLKEWAQFFPWRWCAGDDKPTKIPKWFDRNLVTGKWQTCSIPSNHPATWHTFEDVARVVRATATSARPWLGLAFRFTKNDPFCFIDLDHCRDPLTGRIEDRAVEIIRRLNSYTEVSPSGTGVKVFIRGTKPGPRCNNRKLVKNVEIYDSTQLSTITGNRIDLPGFLLPTDVQDRQEELSILYAETFPPTDDLPSHSSGRVEGAPPPIPPADRSDSWIIDRLSSKPYWTGPNKSEQDQSLANRAAYYCGNDPARIERIMLQAPARRAKWNRKAYMRDTINGAIDWCFRKAWFYEYDLAKWKERQDLEEQIEAISEEDLAALFSGSKKSRNRAASTSPTTPAIDRETLTTIADQLIASLSEPPSPADVCEDELLSAAHRHAAQLAHQDRPAPCTCGYKRSMFNPKTGTFRACHVLCGRWRCSTCAPKKKTQWQTHLRMMVETVPVPGGLPTARRSRTDPVYLANVRDDPTTTKRILRHVQRLRGQYARIKYTPGRQLVVCTVPLSPRDDAESLPPTEAAARVVQAIQGMLIFGDTRKPIFTCRAWKLPPRKPGDWTVVGDFPGGTTKAEIVEAMEAEVGQTQRVRTGNPLLPFMPWVAEVALPPPPEDDPDRPGAPELSRTDQARAFHARLANRVLGLPADDGDCLTAVDIDQLFGVPAVAGPAEPAGAAGGP